jgi:hypothetical protein
MSKVTREISLTPVSTSPTTGKKIQFLRLLEQNMRGGIASESRSGFVAVDPLQAKNVEQAVKDGKIILEFGPINRQTRLNDVQVMFTPEYEAELEALEAAGAQAAAAPSGAHQVLETK